VIYWKGRKYLLMRKKKHETAITPTPNELFDETGLDLVILWETALETGSVETITLIGQQNICNVSFSSPTTVDKSVSNNNALRFSIESPRKMTHDFSEDSFSIVPVTFHIQNRSSAPLSFRLETLKPHENMDSNPSASSIQPKRSQYFWAGETQHYVLDLAPEAKVALGTNACFSRPGVYNLNRYKFVILDNKGRVLQQIYSPFQHIIIVEDKNEMSH